MKNPTTADLERCMLSRKEIARLARLSYNGLTKRLCGFQPWGAFEAERVMKIIDENPRHTERGEPGDDSFRETFPQMLI